MMITQVTVCNDGKVSTRATKQNDNDGERHTRRQFSFIHSRIYTCTYTLYSTGFIQRLYVLSPSSCCATEQRRRSSLNLSLYISQRMAHAIIIHAWLGVSVGEEEEESSRSQCVLERNSLPRSFVFPFFRCFSFR